MYILELDIVYLFINNFLQLDALRTHLNFLVIDCQETKEKTNETTLIVILRFDLIYKMLKFPLFFLENENYN